MEINVNNNVFTEAVFINGKAKVKPIEDRIQKIKDLLEEEIAKHDRNYLNASNKDKYNVKGFDPEAFWRSTLFKDLEDDIGIIFGFRSVNIEPFIERYIPKDRIFESQVLNCIIWNNDRYPIDGLVTENGFYDKTHSVNINIAISLGLIKALQADEILAVLLHEFGHGIDPALVDINYTEINILSKYMTDRKSRINRSEKRYASNEIAKNKSMRGIGQILFTPIIVKGTNLFTRVVSNIQANSFFPNFLPATDRSTQKKLDKIRKRLEADKDVFNRQNFAEAYADNFARMYGYGIQLMRALQKMSRDLDTQMNKRQRFERERQKMILRMTIDSINDEHKTDIHRINNLIKEYEADIRDPETDQILKTQLQEDLEELKKVVYEYTTNFSDFHNRVNRMIAEELNILPDPNEFNHESADISPENPVTFFSESKRDREKIKKEMEAVTGSERGEFKRIFGDQECSLAKDKNGYYVRTHRCRSKSYESIEKIPKKDVEFVSSTS